MVRNSVPIRFQFPSRKIFVRVAYFKELLDDTVAIRQLGKVERDMSQSAVPSLAMNCHLKVMLSPCFLLVLSPNVDSIVELKVKTLRLMQRNSFGSELTLIISLAWIVICFASFS